MLPNQCRKRIDLDGQFARFCFNYDIIIRDTTFLCLAYINSIKVNPTTSDYNVFNKILSWISDKAFRYGLLYERKDLSSFEEVLEIILKAKERIE